MMTTTLVEEIPPITQAEAGRLATTEYQRVADQLRSLAADDWSKPTDCPLWDVRDMAGHTAGMMATFTGYRTFARTMSGATKAAKRSGGPVVDALTARQVADHVGLSTDQLITKIESVGSAAARWRTSRPALFRRIPIKEEVGGVPETWRLGYLLERILTRDPWMHRVDTARATGCTMELTPEHDGRIVADVVAEWARRHGTPFTLTLTGPAGGEFVFGGGGEPLTLDTLEFCRILSGRAAGAGLLTQEVPF
ncbi:MAG: maleylpyruvate isomerase family mycothiol-dependent enzyme [Acidimicrobiia bacterium]|nr:maleylpyruvate isomerase family mycothiol-dependent enzyme [Acidimicrobiia bacterium]